MHAAMPVLMPFDAVALIRRRRIDIDLHLTTKSSKHLGLAEVTASQPAAIRNIKSRHQRIRQRYQRGQPVAYSQEFATGGV